MVELFKNMSVSGGVLGESNSWFNSTSTGIAETVANVNPRSLGASRTLVLLNGRRQTYLPARLAGGRFVDVNAFPAIAIDRIDVLKEGAGAVYGSDAIAGVVNFITRSQFEGFEVSASYDHYTSSKDGMLGGIWGKKIGTSAPGAGSRLPEPDEPAGPSHSSLEDPRQPGLPLEPLRPDRRCSPHLGIPGS